MIHKGTLLLETERLILRQATMDDVEFMFKNWFTDEMVTKFLTWQPYKTIDEAQGYVKYLMDNYKRDDFYDWVIELKELGEPIGSISVVQFREDIEKAVIGYCLGSEWWHQGIMTEAFKRVIKFMFCEVQLNKIEAYHDPQNPHSGDVMRKCGLTYEGTLRQDGRNNQGICDDAHYSILRNEYFDLSNSL